MMGNLFSKRDWAENQPPTSSVFFDYLSSPINSVFLPITNLLTGTKFPLWPGDGDHAAQKSSFFVRDEVF